MIKDWHLIEGLLDKELCEKIISDVEKNNKLGPGALGGGEYGGVDRKVRRSKIAFIPDEDPYKYIFDIIWRSAIKVNDEFFKFYISKLDAIQFSKYDEKNKGVYTMHEDVFWLTKGDYHRKLSVVVQLSDPSEYTGGDLKLVVESKPLPDSSTMRKQGNVIFFPSFVKHGVLPVTKGTRYSLVAWIEGKKWS